MTSWNQATEVPKIADEVSIMLDPVKFEVDKSKQEIVCLTFRDTGIYMESSNGSKIFFNGTFNNLKILLISKVSLQFINRV